MTKTIDLAPSTEAEDEDDAELDNEDDQAPEEHPVSFGRAAFRSPGLVGDGCVVLDQGEVIVRGSQPPPLGIQVALLLGVTAVPYIAFGVALGIIPAILLLAWYRRRPFKPVEFRIPLDSVSKVRRDGQTVSFACAIPGRADAGSLEVISASDAMAYKLERRLVQAASEPR